MLGFYLVGTCGAILAALGWVGIKGHASGWRFGRVFGPRQIVDGAAPYRASSQRDVRDRGVPKSILAASITSTIWAIFTLALFAPAGGLLALMMLVSAEPAMAGAAIVLFVICCSGLALGVALLAQARALLDRNDSQTESFVRWSLAHHVAVLFYFAILGAVTEGAAGLVLAALVVGPPSLIGVFQTMAITNARSRLAAIAREEEEGVALPPELTPAAG